MHVYPQLCFFLFLVNLSLISVRKCIFPSFWSLYPLKVFVPFHLSMEIHVWLKKEIRNKKAQEKREKKKRKLTKGKIQLRLYDEGIVLIACAYVWALVICIYDIGSVLWTGILFIVSVGLLFFEPYYFILFFLYSLLFFNFLNESSVAYRKNIMWFWCTGTFIKLTKNRRWFFSTCAYMFYFKYIYRVN